ncbi:MAG: hypothetical protein DWI26_06365 [Planctomycetota bacterium]|nr:MAG: hypothetical protein DWI26_06365 [Planctomycetota bacterium]
MYLLLENFPAKPIRPKPLRRRKAQPLRPEPIRTQAYLDPLEDGDYENQFVRICLDSRQLV